MKNQDKIKLLEQILHDFNNSYTWQFEKKLKNSIAVLKDFTHKEEKQ